MALFDFLRSTPPLSFDDFVKALGTRIGRVERPALPIRLLSSGSPLLLIGNPGDGVRVDLDAVYADYVKTKPGERAAFIDSIVHHAEGAARKLLLESPALPWIRRRSHLSMLAATAATPLPYVPLGEELALAVGSRDGNDIVPSRFAQFWESRALDDALEEAKAAAFDPGDVEWEALREGLYSAVDSRERLVELLLRPEAFARLQVRGRPVVAFPTLDRCVVAGTDDDEGLCALAEIARALLTESGEYLTGFVFERVDAEWRPFLPAQDSPAREPLRTLQVLTRLKEIADWRDAATTLTPPPPTAEARTRLLAGGRVASTVRWNGADSVLLPRTDVVELVSEGADDALVPFDALLSVPGLLTRFERIPLPESHLVVAAVTPEQRTELRKHAVAAAALEDRVRVVALGASAASPLSAEKPRIRETVAGDLSLGLVEETPDGLAPLPTPDDESLFARALARLERDSHAPFREMASLRFHACGTTTPRRRASSCPA